MLKLLGLTGCLCSKSQLKVVHPAPKKESLFICKECSKTLLTQEQLDTHMCQYHLKSDSNTTTPKAGSFDEQQYFEWKKEESMVLDRYFFGRMQGDRSPVGTKSVIMEQSTSSFMNLSPSRIDNSPDRFSSKSFLGNEKSEVSGSESGLMKIINTIREQQPRTRIKMEAKFIKVYSVKKTVKRFLISESWMEYYAKYLNGEKTEIPGPIDNKDLKKRLQSKKNQSKSLYAANESVWFFLKTLYGGGPEICHMNEAPIHRLSERMKTEGGEDLSSAIKINTKPKSLTYSQKPVLADLNFCLRPIKMLKNDSNSSLIASFQFLLGVSDLLRCMEQERTINVYNLRNSKFIKGFQDVIDAHLKDNKFFLAANMKKIFQDQLSDPVYLDAFHFLNTYLSGMMSEFSPNPRDLEPMSADLKFSSYVSQTFFSIKNIFGGVILNTIKCLNCGKKTQTYNDTFSLSFPIVHKVTKTIDDCLNLFQKETESESLHYCERCRIESRIMTHSLVSKFPKYLIVHLDRFSENEPDKKKEDLVNYLIENWKVKGSGEKETCHYSLSGVIAHHGLLNEGHYTCYTKRGEEWYVCDDDEVRKIQPKKSIVKDAYILLYQRLN